MLSSFRIVEGFGHVNARVWRAQAPKRVLKAYDEAQQRKA